MQHIILFLLSVQCLCLEQTVGGIGVWSGLPSLTWSLPPGIFFGFDLRAACLVPTPLLSQMGSSVIPVFCACFLLVHACLPWRCSFIQ